MSSEEGVQPGDPLGPLLFTPFLYSFEVTLSVLLDDATIGGAVNDILHDLEVIKEAQDWH